MAKKWIYIDPYFAMSAAGKDGRMSYLEFSDALLNNGWIKFEYFGGENHCMAGKPVADHPYFSNQEQFASIFSLNGNNIFRINELERKYSKKTCIHEAPLSIYEREADTTHHRT